MPDATKPVTVAFVLASYAPDAPAGMERATAALARGLRQLGHRALIITAIEPDSTEDEVDEDLVVLGSVGVTFPASDDELREAISTHGQDKIIAADLRALYRRHHVDIAVYVDALWGLGRLAPACDGVRTVLAMHVVGHDQDLVPALERTDLVIVPSTTVLGHAHDRDYDSTCWQIVPNALLGNHSAPDASQREALRRSGPVRVLARLGPEKNVRALLDAGRLVDRGVEVVLAEAGFEHAAGAQAAEYRRCAHSAAYLFRGSVRDDGLPWDQVQPWLANAAVVIVPSTKETFGLVALEAMSVGTPVVAFDVDNLPTLIGTGEGAGGIVVPRAHGEFGLWGAAEVLLDDPVRYAALSRAAYYRSRDYLPTTVAHDFLKAVR
ncbi:MULTISPECIES: glycosyltransferase family 4 protein [Pseudonocardiaceae]|uniref:Glycosyltransferase family 4 protein n=3 Tax=Pseudonocardiaceae TaxID=2070 RepID=A0A8E1W5K0_9PSEU|nr:MULTISPECIES: glycosyltransferase family 4 protein [Pseudonocardiaceae]PXY18159.1 glycosyltransferase [Prauserella coralliicola]AXB46111.1 glycosyltransferase [Amycolatopsis albispora]MBB2504072.1 glycosyltransferase family 4 protein [Amycolatopsis echigonensis]PXY25611.1 glycosyltransferase [Prauserella flavalba]RBM22344.1 glycosyltransferase [Prauserella sp. PE36]